MGTCKRGPGKVGGCDDEDEEVSEARVEVVEVRCEAGVLGSVGGEDGQIGKLLVRRDCSSED